MPPPVPDVAAGDAAAVPAGVGPGVAPEVEGAGEPPAEGVAIGAYVQVGTFDPGAHAARPAAMRPPPAMTAPRRKPRRETSAGRTPAIPWPGSAGPGTSALIGEVVAVPGAWCIALTCGASSSGARGEVRTQVETVPIGPFIAQVSCGSRPSLPGGASLAGRGATEDGLRDDQ